MLDDFDDISHLKIIYFWFPEHEIQLVEFAGPDSLLASLATILNGLAQYLAKGGKCIAMHTLHFHVWIFSIHLLVPIYIYRYLDIYSSYITSDDSSQVNLVASWPKMFVMTSSILYGLPFH